jgi:arginine/lysine/ornithine decarboxylase
VLLTRPSYQGVMCSSSTLRDIARLCHSKGVPLIVDEAHGSHLRFLKRPEQLGKAEHFLYETILLTEESNFNKSSCCRNFYNSAPL